MRQLGDEKMLLAIIVFGAAVWALFQLSRPQRMVALSIVGAIFIVLLVALSAGPIFGNYLEDPIGPVLISMSLIGAAVAWFVYAVTLAIVRKRSPSEQAFIKTRSKIRKAFLIYGGTYVAVSVVIRFVIFLYLIRETHAWESAGFISLIIPKWPFYLAAIFGYQLFVRRKAAAVKSR
jgi:hypothetical protein